jgi:ribosomal protein S18 acetylase RimI-like enzyme
VVANSASAVRPNIEAVAMEADGPLTIRRATVADAAQVAAVLNAVIAEGRYTLFDKPFSESEERSFIASLGDRAVLHVAVAGETIVGVQCVDRFANYADSVSHVAHVGTWLLPEGRGIGKQLWARSLAFAREHGYRKVVISVLAHNDRALRYYRGLGFTDIGLARDHVRLNGTFHDEVFLERAI